MVVLGMLMAAGTLTVTAPAASAAPAGCTTVNGGNFAESLCTEGTGQHRVVMVQRHFLYPDVPDLRCEGPWMPVGLTSQIDCASEQVIALTVQTLEEPLIFPVPTDMMTPVPANTNSPRIRIPKPAGLATPVPVDCFRQKFESLIVRVSDNKPAYVFVVNVRYCVNRTANFAIITNFEGDSRLVGAKLEQIVSLKNEPATTTPAVGQIAVQIALQDRIEFRACQDPNTQAFCQTYIHTFTGSVSALTTTGRFTFDPVA
ncbi:hypothetical protein CVV72_18300 [Amycolatopsis sp. TNS106]|nr:hypothetical protein CVV72_18300 [Amycolatopsis sp. TNS106]